MNVIKILRHVAVLHLFLLGSIISLAGAAAAPDQNRFEMTFEQILGCTFSVVKGELGDQFKELESKDFAFVVPGNISSSHGGDFVSYLSLSAGQCMGQLWEANIHIGNAYYKQYPNSLLVVVLPRVQQAESRILLHTIYENIIRTAIQNRIKYLAIPILGEQIFSPREVIRVAVGTILSSIYRNGTPHIFNEIRFIVSDGEQAEFDQYRLELQTIFNRINDQVCCICFNGALKKYALCANPSHGLCEECLRMYVGENKGQTTCPTCRTRKNDRNLFNWLEAGGKGDLPNGIDSTGSPKSFGGISDEASEEAFDLQEAADKIDDYDDLFNLCGSLRAEGRMKIQYLQSNRVTIEQIKEAAIRRRGESLQNFIQSSTVERLAVIFQIPAPIAAPRQAVLTPVARVMQVKRLVSPAPVSPAHDFSPDSPAPDFSPVSPEPVSPAIVRGDSNDSCAAAEPSIAMPMTRTEIMFDGYETKSELLNQHGITMELLTKAAQALCAAQQLKDANPETFFKTFRIDEIVSIVESLSASMVPALSPEVSVPEVSVPKVVVPKVVVPKVIAVDADSDADADFDNDSDSGSDSDSDSGRENNRIYVQ